MDETGISDGARRCHRNETTRKRNQESAARADDMGQSRSAARLPKLVLEMPRGASMAVRCRSHSTQIVGLPTVECTTPDLALLT